MKLTFKKTYLSIDEFTSVELPDFTVLTGTNGSGKSHLLMAIKNGSSIIEGFENLQIALLTNKDFELPNQGRANPMPGRYTTPTDSKALAWNFFSKNMQSQVKTIKEKNLGNEYERLKDLSRKDGLPLWRLDEIINEGALIDILMAYKSEITDLFNKNDKNNNQMAQVQSLFSLLKTIPYSIDEISEKEFFELYYQYSLTSGFLPTAVGECIWDHFCKYDTNTHRQQRDKDGRKGPSPLTDDDFEKKHGPKRWERFNDILKDVGLGKYKINDPESEGLEQTDSYECKLTDKNKNIAINFLDLSSGEKIMLALAASLFKPSSDNVFPQVLLLDEVDSSLHPSMIKVLLNVIDDLVLKRGVKVILVTHSPSTVALAPEKSIFVVNHDGPNRIEKKPKDDALSILSEGFVSLTQNLISHSISCNLSIPSNPDNVIFTEGITDKIIIEYAWMKINPDGKKMPFYIQDCYGAPFLATLFNTGHDATFKDYPNKKFIALFDSDEGGRKPWGKLKKKRFSIVDGSIPDLKKHRDFPAYALLLPKPRNNHQEDTPNGLSIEYYLRDSLNSSYFKSFAKGIKFVGDKNALLMKCKNYGKEDFKCFVDFFAIIDEIFQTKYSKDEMNCDITHDFHLEI